MATREEIIAQLTFKPDIQRDVDGIVCRILRVKKRTPLVDRTPKAVAADSAVIDYIMSRYGDAWRVDVLQNFKRIQRGLAEEMYRQNPNCSSEECWYMMQDRLARNIADTYKLKPLM